MQVGGTRGERFDPVPIQIIHALPSPFIAHLLLWIGSLLCNRSKLLVYCLLLVGMIGMSCILCVGGGGGMAL